MGKGYNRRNFLLRVIDIQKIYTEHHERGCTDVYIYKNYIYPTYKIGRTTFYNYLATPAIKDLKLLEAKMLCEKREAEKQLKMFSEDE